MTYTPVAGQIWPQGQPRQKQKNRFFRLLPSGEYTLEGYQQPFSSDAVITDPDFDKVTLLLDMEGTAGSASFVDRSNAANTITAVSGAVISNTRAKFGSGSFSNNNQGRYLEIGSSANLSFSGDFTIEVWFWAEASQPSYPTVFEIGQYTNGILFRPYHGGGGLWINGNNYGDFLNETLIPKQQWNHAAFVRSGTSFVCYLNGQVDKTATISGTINSTGGLSRIGSSTHSSGQHLNGYIDEVRVTNGLARYLAPFTPPTEPFPLQGESTPEPEPEPGSDPYFANVSLLLHMDGSNGSTNFTDSSSNSYAVTAAGNAQVSTADPKFGTGALTLDGTGDYLTVPAGPDFQFGTGDFTVECWVYVNTGNSNNGLFTFGNTSSGLAVAIISGQWRLSVAGAGGFGMAAVTTGVWQHLAVSRSGTNLRMFIDGTQHDSPIANSTDFTDNALKIGYYYSDFYAISAKIDEFRVTKGVARYTENFTPPTEPFPDQSEPEPENPVVSLQPLFWYDFADESSVALSGSNIASIQDKGSQEYDLTPRATSGPTYENGINGLKCANFGSPGHIEFLRNTNSANYTIGEAYIVLSGNNTFGATFPNYNGLIGSAMGEAWRVYGLFNSLTANGLDQIFSNNFSTSGAGLPAVNNPIVLRLKKSDNTGFSSNGGFILGNETQNSALGRGWGGFIGEVVGFTSPLSSQDREAVLGYLYEKWAITP